MSAEKRINQINSFLEKNPNDPFLHYALATEYKGLGKLDLAKEKLEFLLENMPEYVATYYHLGKMVQEEGDTQAAEKLFEKGIKLARTKGDQLQLRELQQALNQLMEDEW